jgi:hypothetical protein
MCSFKCSCARRFHHILSCSQLSLQIVRHEEVRRPGWSGDVTKTWNDASGTHGSQLKCCVRGGAVLAEKTVHHRRRQVPRLSPAFLDIVFRLGSLYTLLVSHATETTYQWYCISSCHPSAQAVCRGTVWAGGQKSTHLDRRHLRDSAQYCLVKAFVIKAMNIWVTQEQKDFSTSFESFNTTCCTEIVKWSHKPRDL